MKFKPLLNQSKATTKLKRPRQKKS